MWGLEVCVHLVVGGVCVAEVCGGGLFHEEDARSNSPQVNTTCFALLKLQFYSKLLHLIIINYSEVYAFRLGKRTRGDRGE